MPLLLRELKKFYKTSARKHLPWRKTRDPYRILVSELMLQQTQVDRVVPFYAAFLKQFPTPQALAQAPLSKVLKVWQGLGYNRRAKFLHEAAKIIAKQGFPKTSTQIEELPGVGPYTARAVAAFAFNEPEIFIETNIRTVFLHHCYQGLPLVTDTQIAEKVAEALKKSKMEPRDFYAALMDYGSYLKKSGVRLNSQSKHYTKQSKFEGSARQLRGAILRELLKKPATLTQLAKNLSRKRGEVLRTLTQLEQEGLVQSRDARFQLAE